MTVITSRQHPFVQRCRAIARGRAEGEMLLDGEHVIAEAVSAGIRVKVAAIGPRGLERPGALQLRSDLEAAGAQCLEVSDGVLDAASPVRSPGGIVAIAARPSSSLAEALAGECAMAVALAGIQDPGNVGAVIRAADAAGATGAVALGPTADPFGWKALRGSMGSAFRLPIALEPDSATFVAQARSRRLDLVGLVPRGGVRLYDADLTRPAVIVAGGEGAGLPADLAAALDLSVSIPMGAGVESLNVAVAVGVVLFEAGRQRGPRT